MMISICKSKIHRATITDAHLDYIGSITIDTDLMKLADLVPYERVHIANINNGERFETYVIEGEAGSGTIALNGAAARKGQIGDLIIIISYGDIDKREAVDFKPAIVHVDKQNHPLSQETPNPPFTGINWFISSISEMSQQKAVIILAAGKGKRMKSDLPKVLHPIKGRPMIEILLDTLTPLHFNPTIVVIGHGGEQLQAALAKYPVEFAWQREQLGTGHAVMMTQPQLKDFSGITLVAAGDVPFLSADAIRKLLAVHEQTKASATCLSAIVADPTGYGRIVRGAGKDELKEIIEHKDASPEVLKIAEINTGTFCFDNSALFSALTNVTNTNSQAEYYLTDTVKIMHDNGLRVSVTVAENSDEVRGVNSPEQLEELAGIFANRL